MPNENQIDVVDLVSGSLHKINMTLASMLPNASGYDALEQKRDELEARLKRLVRGFFSDNTRRFIAADASLVQVNQRMQADLQSLQNMQQTIDAITSLINAVDGFIKAVFPMPG